MTRNLLIRNQIFYRIIPFSPSIIQICKPEYFINHPENGCVPFMVCLGDGHLWGVSLVLETRQMLWLSMLVDLSSGMWLSICLQAKLYGYWEHWDFKDWVAHNVLLFSKPSIMVTENIGILRTELHIALIGQGRMNTCTQVANLFIILPVVPHL